MDALEAIRERRMIPRVGPQAPSREDIEELLELAVRAPVHRATDPWRFYVLSGDGRQRLAAAIAHEAIETGTDAERAREDAAKKVERAPVIVVFTVTPSDDPKVVESEEFASVAMAMQNFLLGAYAKGLGAMLRTGPPAYHAAARDHLGLALNEHVAGFIYIGVPDGERPKTPRGSAAERTTWVDSP